MNGAYSLTAEHIEYNQFKIELTILQWLKEDFLGYLDKWSNSVDSIPDIDPKQKARTKLSHQTIEGLHMTGMEKLIAAN